MTAVTVGSNGTRSTTRDVIISDNTMDTLIGGKVTTDGENYPETHAVLGCGTSFQLLRNTVRHLNAGQDHEALYLKASRSTVAGNLVLDCGKDIYDYGKPTVVDGNSVETQTTAIATRDGAAAQIANNLTNSYDEVPIKAGAGVTANNTVCAGGDCQGLSPPRPTCQNLGNQCCPSCPQGPQPAHDGDCPSGMVCCAACDQFYALHGRRPVGIVDLMASRSAGGLISLSGGGSPIRVQGIVSIAGVPQYPGAGG